MLQIVVSLIDAARGVIYDCHMFIVQATGGPSSNLYLNIVHFLAPVLIRHLWQLKTVVFPALVPNMCSSIFGVVGKFCCMFDKM
jgi:hypothetical protein